MLNWQNIIRVIFFISLFCISYPAFACKPLIYPVSYYAEGKISGQVIFLGKVISVEEKKDKGGVIYQTIGFAPTRWFSGEEKATYKVIGRIGTMRGTDCEGVFDFSAKVGEEWLIFGQLSDDMVAPDRFNSIKVLDGKIPPSILKEIEKLEANPANSIAETELTPIKLDISGEPLIIKGLLAPNKRVSYSLTPKKNSNMVIQVQSSNSLVGFTVWDTGYHLAMPIPGDSRKPLLGIIKEDMEETYLPNITWQGDILNRKHVIIVDNYGEKESSFILNIIVK